MTTEIRVGRSDIVCPSGILLCASNPSFSPLLMKMRAVQGAFGTFIFRAVINDRLLRDLGFMPPHLVPHYVKPRKSHKLGAVDHGPAPDGAGLVPQTPEPFQACLTSPARRRNNFSAMKLERRPHRHDHRCFEPVA